ncbi:lectin subunit alpha-like [Musca domestica]|uniref:Lectin subunit alpha-like n=1 Tax=Musca domestica TaxID=7370 RepID=A0ABM3V2F4_MUSDO|nr:lectin subunit alpha-like [Musca domestica]
MQARRTLLWTLLAVQLLCVAGYSKFATTSDGNSYYVETSMAFSWYEALSACASLKMTLLTVDSYSKRMQVDALRLSANAQVWIGGHDLKSSRSFEWISNGKSFDYRNWYSGEPNSKEENCVEMTFPALGWNDVRCSKFRGYICEETPAAKEKNQEIKKLKEELARKAVLLDERAKKVQQLEREKKEIEETKAMDSKGLVEAMNRGKNSINEQLSRLLNVALNQTALISSHKEMLMSLKRGQDEIREYAKRLGSEALIAQSTVTARMSESLAKIDGKLKGLFDNVTSIQEMSSNRNTTNRYYYIYF